MNPRPAQVLFSASALHALEIGEAELPALQQLFEANPAYFELATGSPARPDEARQEWLDRPPPGVPYRAVRLIGFCRTEALGDAPAAESDSSNVSRAGSNIAAACPPFIGMASLACDLFAPAVWHIGFFLFDQAEHGLGSAQAAHTALLQWMAAQGAQWVRLGVIIGNSRAEAFWKKLGYQALAIRKNMAMGQRHHDVQVMAMGLQGQRAASLDDYLALVPRDRSEPEPEAAA